MASSNDVQSLDLPAQAPRREPLAVVGIGCRLPGGIDSPRTLWDALLRGVNAVRDVPADRWNHSRFHDVDAEKTGCIRNVKGGFIDGVDQFDAEFFGYFPAEAQRIDPQQRLLLEVTHEAMEDAGLRRDQLDGSRTAVFTGSFMYDYLCIQAAGEQRDEINPYVAMGTTVAALANRISYDFNLKGPSVSVDTACSSSLTAVHLACRSLWSGDADMAIAGGVNVMLRPESSIMLSKAGFLNPDQACKAFDRRANGYVRGEGVGVVILKPLTKALADGDAIYACVLGTATNQDGRSPEGFTVPNFRSQIELIEAAYSDAGIDPLCVDFVEAHGTGTAVGDPTETLAIGVELGEIRGPDQPDLLIGSIKTNLGHLEGAAGIAGFIKGVLTAHYSKVPPNLHFETPNPGILFEERRMQVPTRVVPLPDNGGPRTVGVNSFGAGGANVHIVVQSHRPATADDQALPVPADGDAPGSPLLYTLSSVHADSLRKLAQRHADFLRVTDAPFNDLAFSAFTRRSRYPHRLAVVGESAKDVELQLCKFAQGEADPAIVATTVTHKKRPKLAFVFSGQGGQWARMGLQTMQREPVFADWMETIDALFERLAGWSLLTELRKDDAETRVNETVVVQPTVMAVQVALVKLYQHYGIVPDAVVGHSIGEVAAAFAAGALTLAQAVNVIYYRSQAQDRASGHGGMLAVGLGMEEAQQLVQAYEGVSIGAVNGPEMIALSGDVEPLRLIAEKLESRGVFHRPIRVQVAYHSHHMEPIKDVMLESLADVQGQIARMQLYSTVTGERETGRHLNAEYWFRNARETVRFTAALSLMLHHRLDTFVEIGPHPVLIGGARSLIKQAEKEALVIPSMTRREPEGTIFLQSLALLAARGREPNVEIMFGPRRRYVRLPTNPWQHIRCWFESPASAELRHGRFDHPFLKRGTQLVTEEGPAVWEAAIDVRKFPYLRDHLVDDEIVFPAAGHLELAWAVAGQQYRHESYFLEDLHFDSPLILPENSTHPLDVRLEIVSGEGDYRICSRPADASEDAPWTRHSSGRINTLHDRFDMEAESSEELVERFRGEPVANTELLYENLKAAGLAYGEKFRLVKELQHRGHQDHGHEWLARLQMPEKLAIELQRNTVHPALLDACLHVIFADVHRLGDMDRIYLPYRIERVRFYRQATVEVWAHVHVTRNDAHVLGSDTIIFDDAGRVVAEIKGLICKRLKGAGSRQTDTLYDGCYEYQWMPAPRDAHRYGRNTDCKRAVIIADESRLTTQLAERFAADNIQPLVVPFDDVKRLDERLADVPLDRRTLIVFAAGLADRRPGWTRLADNSCVLSLLQLAQIIHRRQGVPRLFVVTTGATGFLHDDPLDLGQAVLHGMARVINNECPNVLLSVVDLSSRVSSLEADSLYHELLHHRLDQDETEIALRADDRYVHQLVPVDGDSAEQDVVTDEPGCGGAYRAAVHDPGSFDHVEFRRLSPRDPEAGEVEIAVEAAALNFKDVMNAMGLLPENAVSGGLTGDRLGLEIAGRVLRIGDDVRHTAPGDEVIARVAEGFCGRVVTPAHCVVRKPRTLTPQQAAAIPVVYVTAWYSLHYLARLTAGETVLIHSAAGGVGNAAIQLAQRAGATVIATAGTKEKREFLRQLGIEHVFDSRSLDFYNEVMEVTGGRGVDVVLNFLTGRFITQSIKCLAPFGRFIEIGKTDIYRNSKLGLERLGDNISYFVVDVDRLAEQRSELHRQILTDVVDLFERGDLKPHEITEFPISKLPDALKFMSRAAYRGKIVVSMQDDRVPTLPPRCATFRPHNTYLISGGASGFGLEIARWMVDRGARHLVLLSRSGPKIDADRAAIQAMQDRGVCVLLPHADITDAAAVTQLIERLRSEMPPLTGVVHGAAVMDDATLPAMNMKRFAYVFGPKAQGAWNLHEATRDAGCELDFFVMLSSISAVLGFHGQVNYVAANYFQDALAQYRRQQGLPGTAVNLGVLGQYAGLSRAVNDKQDVISLLESHGMLVMPLEDILAKLEAALIQQPVQRMTGRFDWTRFRMTYPHLVRDTRFVELLSDAALARGSRAKSSGLRETLTELEPDVRHERLEQELIGKLAQILNADTKKFDVSASIDTLSLDSLTLTDLQLWIARSLDITLPLMKLLKGPSISSLSADLLAQLADGAADGSSSAQDAPPSATSSLLTDADGIEILSPWLIRGSGDPESPMRLICFHSMGVGASLFTNFLLRPPADYDLIAVQTPGRENRGDEPVAESMDALVDQITPQLLPLLDRPVVIWGHSFGGIVAWEVVNRLRDRHALQPVHFVVTGTAPPHLIYLWQKREVMLKAMVVDDSPEYLISLSRYVDDPEFLKAILPLMRRDFPLLKSYRYHNKKPLECPISAFAARQDDMVYTDEIREWSQHTQGNFELIEVEGDHWFLNRNRAFITSVFGEIAARHIGDHADSNDQVATVESPS